MSTKPLRIHHVVSDIHRQDSGLSYSVVRLAEELAKLGHEVRIHTLEPRPERLPDVPTTFYPRLPLLRRLGISAPMRRGLAEAAEGADVMHVHGLWMMPNIYPAIAVGGTRCRLVHSPHGMLEAWARRWHSRRKRIFAAAFQNRALARVDAFHTTSEAEAEAVLRAGYSTPIAVIPFGIDTPPDVTARRDPPRTALYLGRIHPVKNVDGLIRAWIRIEENRPDWSLEIAGPGDVEYLRTLEQLAQKAERVTIRPAAYGSDKDGLLRRAHLFVLPTHSENFGIVVAEALSYGIPVIVSKGAPWGAIVEQGCGWWVNNDDAALAQALDTAMARSPDELMMAGQQAMEWVAMDFAWRTVAKRTEDMYRTGVESPTPGRRINP